MTDLNELSKELGWSEAEANAILAIYERDKLASIPTVANCFVDRSARLGEGTKVWHYAIVLADVVAGENVSIGARAEIGRGTVIGHGSRIGSGVFLPPNSTIGERVFIGPNVTCTDDKHPRVGNGGYVAQPPVIEDDVSIGAGVVILPGVRIGHHAFIAAGAIVTKDVPPHTHVRGEPSRERPMPSQFGLVA